MTKASTKQARTPTLASTRHARTPTIGNWALTSRLGERREYVLYTAERLTPPIPGSSAASSAYLRILGAAVSETERSRFLAEVAIVSANEDHFLPVHSLRSHGEELVAATAIPQGTLLDFPLCRHAPTLVSIAMQLAEGLRILHSAGRVHGALCRGSVELISSKQPRVRLLDTGMGLELGHSYSATTRQRLLPPEVLGIVTATEEWDIYGLGALGLHMMEQPHLKQPLDIALAALRELFSACTAESPSLRPNSLHNIQHRLRHISQLNEARAVVCRPPRLPSSRAARVTPVEANWFVQDSLSEAEAAAIEGFAPQRASTLSRFFGSALSVGAGTALALMLGALFGIEAFGF